MKKRQGEEVRSTNSRGTDLQVGFVGVGHMGEALAVNALRSGFRVGVYDIASERVDSLVHRGAIRMSSPREVGYWADIVGVAVVNDTQVEKVILGDEGILAGTRTGVIIVVHSTVKVETVVKLGETAAARGVEVLDVSMSGGIDGAESARLSFMVGGEKSSFERCRPVLEASATTIVHLGPLGAGVKTKLIQQAIFAINKHGAYEGLFLVTAAGLDPVKVGQALNGSSGQSYAADGVFSRAAQGITAVDAWRGPGIPSLTMALEFATEHGLDLPALRNACAFLSARGGSGSQH